MSPIDVKADGAETVQTAVPEFVTVDVEASGDMVVWTTTPEFVTYEIAG